jgi:anion-transporting  ArsA/GET3 family ATPase
MSNVHMVLQSKGGVGKSMISAILAQYLSSKGSTPLCLDIDAENPTLSRFKSLNVKRLQVVEDSEINPRLFDAFIEQIDKAKAGDVIVDSGTSTYVSFAKYLASNQVPALLSEMGHKMTVHIVIVGGDAMVDTIGCFADLVTQYPVECNFVVWLNPFFGAIEENGKHFEQTKAFLANKNRVAAIVQIPKLKAETHGHDFSQMMKTQETFDEAIGNSAYTIMARQRLKLTKNEFFAALDAASVI